MRSNKHILSWFFLLLILLGCTPDFEQVRHTVIRIDKGNTLILKSGHEVRLIGVSSTAASQHLLEQTLLNERVHVIFDKTSYPEYTEPGVPLFAYVRTLDGLSINGMLLQRKITQLDQEHLTDSLSVFQAYTQGAFAARSTRENLREAAHPVVSTRQLTNSLVSLYEQSRPAVFMVLTNSKQGTGFFVSEGVGVTNYHVLEGASLEDIYIVTHDKLQLPVKEIIAYSDEDDYVVFRIDTSRYPSLPVAPVEPQVGEDVFAIGNPKGLEHTLSTGIVSSYRDNRQLIQTTTEITHGSSGGPLLNMKGEVVGITTSGLGEANLNFAVNIDLLRNAW